MRIDLAPTPDSFWIEPGRLLCGRYAGSARDNVERLLAAGVTLFLDLTEEGEVSSYASWVVEPARWVRMPVRDFTVPSAEQVGATLDSIDGELARGGVVYLHCFGGCGRTGTVASCWLVGQGHEPEAALARFAELSRPICGRRCPETEEQRALVLGWSARR